MANHAAEDICPVWRATGAVMNDTDLLYMLGSEQLCRSCVEKYAPALLPETLCTVTIDNNGDAAEQPPECAEEPDR